MPKITVAYFRLKEPKCFHNGNFVPGGALLVKSSIEDGQKTLYNTVEQDEIQWFYAESSEVEFVEEKEENWTLKDLEERRKMIDGWV